MRKILSISLFVAVAVMVLLPATAGAVGYVHLQTWGGVGSSDGRANWPDYLWADSKGSVWVADWNNDRVQRFTADGGFMESFGSLGSGNGQFLHPTGVCYDEAHQVIYVADSGNSRIQKFTRTGVYLGQWGSAGAGNSQFNNPHGIGVDGAGNVYVADENNNRVQVFDSGGTWLRQIGSAGSGDGQFSQPAGIVVLEDGTVFVSEFGNSRIQKFDPAGTWAKTFNTSPGSGDNQLSNPMQLSQDKHGNLLVCDWGNNRIARFTQAGTWLDSFGSTGGALDGTLSSPEGVSGDARGFIYVSDLGTSRIQKFVYDETVPVLSHDYDGEWHSQPFNVTFSAVDDFTAVPWLRWSPTWVGWTDDGTIPVAASSSHANDGVITRNIGAGDAVSNWAYKTLKIKVDTRAPISTVSGVPAGWTSQEVNAHIAATDIGSGVNRSFYDLDGGGLTELPDTGIVTITAPGQHTLQYWSQDNCADTPNQETPKSVQVYIDQVGPDAVPMNTISVRRGRSATFKYQLNDDFSPTCTVKLKIMKKSKTVKTISLGTKIAAAGPHAYSKKLKIGLAPGKYTWTVVATDLAGNTGSYAAKKLTVKP